MFKIVEWTGEESQEHTDIRDVRGFLFGVTKSEEPIASPYRYAYHGRNRTEAEALAAILNGELRTGDARSVLRRAVNIAQGRALANAEDRLAGIARLESLKPPVAEAVEP